MNVLPYYSCVYSGLKSELFFAHLNINSFRSKLELLTEKTTGNINIFLISQTNSDKSFPDCQLQIDAVNTAFRADHDKKGGGNMLLLREDLPVKVLLIDRANESNSKQTKENKIFKN